MLPRLFAAVIFALLPLAPPARLNSTQLLSIAAGLLVFLVVWETVAGLERRAALFESWRGLLSPAEHGRAVLVVEYTPSAIDNYVGGKPMV